MIVFEGRRAWKRTGTCLLTSQTGTGMPRKNAFGTPQYGAYLSAALHVKLPVSFGQQPKLRNDHISGFNYSTISASQISQRLSWACQRCRIPVLL